MFESGNRPYLEARFPFQQEPLPETDELRYFSPEDYRLPFSLRNHGSVPGVLIGWSIDISFNNQAALTIPTRDSGLAIIPGRSGPLVNEHHSGAANAPTATPGRAPARSFRRVSWIARPATVREAVVLDTSDRNAIGRKSMGSYADGG